MKTLMILLAVMAMFSGCAHMPSWMLKAHVEGYDRLHPDDPVAEPRRDLGGEPADAAQE